MTNLCHTNILWISNYKVDVNMSHLNVVQNLSVARYKQDIDCNTYQSKELLPAEELWCHNNSGIRSELDRLLLIEGSYQVSEISAVRRFSAYSAFEEDYAKHHVILSPFQRAALSVGAAAVSLADPSRGDMIACLAETTSGNALVHCLNEMQKTPEGQRILKEKPRINSSTVDLSWLKSLPEDTLGRTYSNFLEVNNVTPDSRAPTRFVDDVEQAYVMQRYREVHDIFHAVLLMPTTMLGEVTVKWVEALQTKLPMCVGGAIFGAARLRPRQRKLYLNHHLQWAISTGKNAKFLLGAYFEERWEQPLQEFHKEMNVVPLIPLT